MGITVSGVSPGAFRRATAVLRWALAALLALVLFPAAAWANCGGQTYTYTLTTSSSTGYNLNSGQSLRVQGGTYTGNIDNLASNAKICVDSGATFRPGNMNNVAGQIINYGTVTFQNSVSFAGGFSLDNFGTTTHSSGANYNGAATINNRSNANLYYRQTVQFSNGSTFNNDGYVQADGNFNLQSGTSFINTFDVLVKDTFNPDGVVNNTGRVHALTFININSSSAAKNWCSWIADGGFNNNSGQTENYGLIFINWTDQGQGGNYNMWQNNQTFKMGPDSVVYGWRYINNSTITNTSSTGGGRFYFAKPSNLTANTIEHTKNQGPFTGLSSSNKINFYDETQATPPQLFDYQSQAPTNSERIYFEPPPINYAAPTCSPAIRQVLDGTWTGGSNNPPPTQYDYSDAPISYGAPFHQIVSGLYLGTVPPDWDGNGNGDWNGDGVVDNMSFNTPNADGDDLGGVSGLDDEDGIVSMPTISKGVSTTLNVKVNGAGYLTGWIDYNGNGTFEDTSAERIAYNAQDNGGGTGLALDNSPAGDGIIRLIFTPPANAAATKTYIRLRWSASLNLGPTGPSTSGEIEDYTFTFGIAPEPETPPGGGNGASGGSTPSTCTSPQTVVIQTGYGYSQTNSGTVSNPANAVGNISAQGAYASTSNSANLGASGVLTIDLVGNANNNIPAGGDITISIARPDASSRVLVEVSANGSSWTMIGSYGSGGTISNDFNNGVLKRFMFEAPAGGIRYVRFTRQAGTFWVDGVTTADMCNIPVSLTVVKSMEMATSGEFPIPGNDVIYNIIVTNTGSAAADSAGVLVIDELPSNITFRNSAFGGTGGTNPVTFSQVGSGLTFTYGTHVRFSNAATRPTSWAACTYTGPPTTPATGYNATIKHVCVQPAGTLNGSSSFTLRFKAQIK